MVWVAGGMSVEQGPILGKCRRETWEDEEGRGRWGDRRVSVAQGGEEEAAAQTQVPAMRFPSQEKNNRHSPSTVSRPSPSFSPG